MSWINRKLILDCLKELSSRDEQRRLWLAKAGEVSSFTEVVEQLFTDSGLEELLHSRQTDMGSVIEEALLTLENLLSTVDRKLIAAALIDSEPMEKVRASAMAVLALIDDRKNIQ